VATLRDASPDGLLIGTSTDDPNEARSLVEDGASYIGCGTVYPTATKVDAGAVLGVDGLDRVARAVTVPVIGIGGITPERSAEVARTAASGIAVIASVMAAADVRRAVTALMEPWDRRA
jgi:thiamine-phosphate pyrophosphorylase